MSSQQPGVFDDSPPDLPLPASRLPTSDNDDDDKDCTQRGRTQNRSYSSPPQIVEDQSFLEDDTEFVENFNAPLSDLLTALPPGAMSPDRPPSRNRSFAVCEGEESQPAKSTENGMPELRSPLSIFTVPLDSAASRTYWATMRRFGFPPRTVGHVLEAEIRHHALNEQQAATSEKEFHAALQKGVPLLAQADDSTREPLVKLARKYGIPSHLRGILWLTLTGVAQTVEQNPEFCAEVLRQFGETRLENSSIIEKDLERTFPDHPYFRVGEAGHVRLKRVLHALCWRNPLLGYCQSFNFLAAVMLIFLEDEEAVFWVMCYVTEQLLPNDYYSANLKGVKIDQLVIPDLMKMHLSKLHQHFSRIGFDLGLMIPAWSMSLFVGVFPIETVAVIWDYFLSHERGSMSTVPMAIILALFKLSSDELLAVDDAGEMTVAMARLAQTQFDGVKLVRTAHDLKVSGSVLQTLRGKYRSQIAQEEAQKRAQQRSIQQAAMLSTPVVPRGISAEQFRSDSASPVEVASSTNDESNNGTNRQSTSATVCSPPGSSPTTTTTQQHKDPFTSASQRAHKGDAPDPLYDMEEMVEVSKAAQQKEE